MSDGPGDEERPPEWQRPRWGPQEPQQPQQPQWQQPQQDQPQWQQPPQPWGQQQPYYYQAGPRTPGSATAALILGICAVTLCAPICGPLAIIYGHKARREVGNSDGALTGSGLGLAGIIMGWVAVALTVIVVLAIIGLAANE
jgi:hypothetical protein